MIPEWEGRTKIIELALMLEAKYLEMQITHKHMSDDKTFA